MSRHRVQRELQTADICNEAALAGASAHSARLRLAQAFDTPMAVWISDVLNFNPGLYRSVIDLICLNTVGYDSVWSVARNLPSNAFMKNNLLHPRSPEGTTIAKIVGAAITGTLAYVAAAFTTIVESGGFWQYFFLGACILFFICAVSFVVLASIEGMRIDHAGLSFEPRKILLAEQKTEMNKDWRTK